MCPGEKLKSDSTKVEKEAHKYQMCCDSIYILKVHQALRNLVQRNLRRIVFMRSLFALLPEADTADEENKKEKANRNGVETAL